MWLETLTLQTHESSKASIFKLYQALIDDAKFSRVHIRVFFQQNAVLNVKWHLHHDSIPSPNCSQEAATIIELLKPFGPVLHLTWQQLERNQKSL